MDRFLRLLVPRLIRIAYLVLAASIRWQWQGTPYSNARPERCIYAFWHARMLLMPYPFRSTLHGLRHRHRRFHGYMLISEHRDGGFIADTMHLLGIRTVRGSSTRGGARAMLRMIRAVREEACNLGITPDGPKGPREKVKKGSVQLAMKTGLPIVPVCYAASRCWRLGSWDRFYVPKPFSRGVFVFGEPIRIREGEEMARALARVQAGMDATQRLADTFFT